MSLDEELLDEELLDEEFRAEWRADGVVKNTVRIALEKLGVGATLRRSISATHVRLARSYPDACSTEPSGKWAETTMRELSQQFEMSSGTLSRYLSLLHKAGFIDLKRGGSKGITFQIKLFPVRKEGQDTNFYETFSWVKSRPVD